MKYDERLLNDAVIGDRVYGYDEKEELIKAIEREDNPREIYTEIVLVEVSDDNRYRIYDRDSCEYEWVNYIYPVEQFLARKNTKMQNILDAIDDGTEVTYEDAKKIVNLFFKLKSKGLLAGPNTENEEIVLDYSFDLENEEDCERIKEELQCLPIRDKAWFLRKVDCCERFYCKTVDNRLVKIITDDDYYFAVCNLLTRTFDSWA